MRCSFLSFWFSVAIAAMTGLSCAVSQVEIDGKLCAAQEPCPDGYACVRPGRGGDGACRPAAVACPPSIDAPADETCDGVDQDCNGWVDDVDGCIRTLAGAGPPGLADGPAETARFAGPSQLAADGAGGAFVADDLNHSIRHANAAGAVDTVAGDGRCGFADGPSTQARFCRPVGVAWDGRGLYVADSQNHRIRRIENGAVTTVAGTGEAGGRDGAALSAQLDRPAGLFVMPDGALLIADEGNHAVRRFDPETRTLSTFAGLVGQSGTADGAVAVARFNRPYALAADGTFATVFVAELGRIRAINGGVVTTFSTGITGGDAFDAPGQLAYDDAQKALIVADRKLYVSAADGGQTVSLAGSWLAGYENGHAARFRAPTGLLRLGVNDYLVSDGNHRLRRLRKPGALWDTSDFAGGTFEAQATDGEATSSARLSDPAGLSKSAGEVLAWVEPQLNLVRIFKDGSVVTVGAGETLASGFVNGTYAAARFYRPASTAFVDEVLYVADSANNAIRRIDSSLGRVSTLAGAGASARAATDGPLSIARFDDPQVIAPGRSPTGAPLLFVADVGNALLRRIDLEQGQVSTLAGIAGQNAVRDGPKGTATLQNQWSVAADESGAVWVLDGWARDKLRRVASDGTVRTVSTLPAAATAIAFARDGRLIVAAYSGLFVVEPSTGTAMRSWPSPGRALAFGWRDGEREVGELGTLTGVVTTETSIIVLDFFSRRIRELWGAP